jgi:hypothetical protein
VPSEPPTGWSIDLDATVEELFDAFAHRPKPVSPQLCVGHCTSEADYRALCRISPRDLNGDLLDRYRGNTSFDDVLMMHFMPALLRAMPTEAINDLSITIPLNVRWPQLTDRERAAIDAFCQAWFTDVLRHRPAHVQRARYVLAASTQIGLGVGPYLTYWETVDTDAARWQLIDTILDGFDERDGHGRNEFDAWLFTPAAQAMIARCGEGELTDHDREQLDVASWAIDLRAQGRW